MVARIKKTLPVILIAAVFLLPQAALSSDVFLGSAYTPEDLARVRAWEQTWAGKRIDGTNVDQVKDFLPQGLAQMYQEPQSWGAPSGEALWFTIVPYRQMPTTTGYDAATKKYAGKAQIGPDGMISNIQDIAGLPFPEPKDGTQVALNFWMNNRGDSSQYRRYSPNINPKSRTERLSDQEYWELFFVNRTEVDPLPALPDSQNRRGYRFGYFLHMYLPAEFLNTRMFNLRYIDMSKEDDAYLYYSQFRRIRKMSTAQRTDSIDGTDLIYDDEYLWDGQLSRNTYTLVGRRDLLATRHQDMRKTSRPMGQGIANGFEFERCNTFVVEAINKDPNYIYSKRVWYVDPESYYILATEIYDAPGRFWKLMFNHLDMLPTATGQSRPFIVGTTFIDFQRTHSGLSDQDNERYYRPKISTNVQPTMFTISELQRTY